MSGMSALDELISEIGASKGSLVRVFHHRQMVTLGVPDMERSDQMWLVLETSTGRQVIAMSEVTAAQEVDEAEQARWRTRP